jgi:hypothetical protein
MLIRAALAFQGANAEARRGGRVVHDEEVIRVPLFDAYRDLAAGYHQTCAEGHIDVRRVHHVDGSCATE